MASSNSSSSASKWTRKENKRFESALAVHAENSASRWENVVRYIGGTKTIEEVKRHYQLLVADINDIEAGRIPLPNYADDSNSNYDSSSGGSNSNSKGK